MSLNTDRFSDRVTSYGPEGLEEIIFTDAQREIRDFFAERIADVFRAHWDNATQRLRQTGMPEEAADDALYEVIESLIENGWDH